MSKPPFLPSPRPRSHTRPEDAQQLTAATGDLGFTRASNAPQEPPVPPHLPHKPRPGAAAQVGKTPAPTRNVGQARATSLKFEVPDAVWTALRQEALNRRVTVKYLVLEALAAKGYAVDLSTIPEDGRRLR